jgi:putative membrane protein
MKRNNPVSEPSRQSPLAIGLLILRFATNLLRQFWPIALLLLINRGDRQEFHFMLVFLLFAFVSTIGSILSYFRLYYWMDDTQFYMNKGIFNKQKLQIPFERIQAIKLEQSVFHQAFNVTKLKIETAGSKGSELILHALKMETAHEIRSYIFSRKEELVQSGESKEVDADNIEIAGFDEGEKLFSLSLGTLVKIGISQNHLRTLGVIFVFLLVMFERLFEIFFPDTENIDIEGYNGFDIFSNLSFFGLLVMFFILISVGFSVGQSIIRHADFVVYRTREGLRIIGGLFNRIEQIVVRRKIQMIIMDTNPIRRFLGLRRIRFFQASGTSLSLSESIIVPGCTHDQSLYLMSEYVDPKLIGKTVFKPVQPVYAIRYFLISLCVPLLILTVIGLVRFGSTGFWLLSLVPLLGLLAWLHFKYLRYGVTDEHLIVRKGVFYRTESVLKLYKIQSVDLYRSFYELRHDLGSVVVYSAARRIYIPFLKLEEARLIVDYLTSKIEMDKRHWI